MSVALQSAPCISELVNKPGPWSLMWQDLQLQRNRMYRTNILLMPLAPKFNGNPIGSAWLYPSFQAHLLAQAASSRKDSSNRRSLGVHLFQPRAAVTSGNITEHDAWRWAWMFRMLLVSESFCLPSQPRDVPNQSTADREREGSNCLKIITSLFFCITNLNFPMFLRHICSVALHPRRFEWLSSLAQEHSGWLHRHVMSKSLHTTTTGSLAKPIFNACYFSMAMQTPCMEDGPFQRSSQRFPDYL